MAFWEYSEQIRARSAIVLWAVSKLLTDECLTGRKSPAHHPRQPSSAADDWSDQIWIQKESPFLGRHRCMSVFFTTAHNLVEWIVQGTIRTIHLKSSVQPVWRDYMNVTALLLCYLHGDYIQHVWLDLPGEITEEVNTMSENCSINLFC